MVTQPCDIIQPSPSTSPSAGRWNGPATMAEMEVCNRQAHSCSLWNVHGQQQAKFLKDPDQLPQRKLVFWSPSILEILMVHHQRNKYLFWVQFCLSCPQSLSRYDYLKADHVWPASRKSHTMWSAQGTPFREKDGAGGLKIMGFTDHMMCYTLRMQLTRKALERQWKAHLPRQLGCGAMIWDAA